MVGENWTGIRVTEVEYRGSWDTMDISVPFSLTIPPSTTGWSAKPGCPTKKVPDGRM